jgi:hypothetical protein
MDRRILGFVSQFDPLPTGLDDECPFTVDREYFSAAEWKALNIADDRIGKSVNEDNCELLDDVIQSTGDSIPLRNTFFYAHVLVHLKHFLQVCIDAGIPLDTARKHICIGSDFDGIINPFLNFQTCLDIPGLKTYIRGNFRDFLASLRDSAKWCNALDIGGFVEDLFFGNGYAFVTGFLSK